MKIIGNYELIDSCYHVYDENAPLVFQTIRQIVVAKIPEVELEHTGSTAIGIAGKNIIDVLLICESAEFSEVLMKLEEAGFQISPFQNIPEDRPLRVASIIYQNKRWLIHLHLTKRGSADHRNILFFRDYLCANTEAAEQYAIFILSVLEKRND
jgi:GrpB-like predicted nucleotidyltransferase (UPF0157 family)